MNIPATRSSRTESGIACLSGGRGRHALVLLHGLGANSAVWHPMLTWVVPEWNGAWLAPDFSGHGSSVHRDSYSYEDHARDVLQLVADFDRVFILGHSMGGAVGLKAAAMAPPGLIVSVASLSMKLSFTAEESRWFQERAKTDIQYFNTADEAKRRYLKISGLLELVPMESDIAEQGVVADVRGYRLAMDPKAFMVAADRLPSSTGLPCNVCLATGSEDRIAPAEEMRTRFEQSIVLNGLGHNAHVQAPEMVWRSLSAQLNLA